VIRYIDAHREAFGVEPICDTLQVAPSTYYSAKSRPPCRRRITDEALKAEIRRVHAANFAVYGARKVWRQLNREGIAIARCRTERLMRQMGLAGRVRGRKIRTTVPDPTAPRPADLVERQFKRRRPQPAVGRRSHLRRHLVGLRLHRLRHRRVQPPHRGLASGRHSASRARPRRLGDGHLVTPVHPGRSGASLGQGRAISGHPLHRAPGRRRGRGLRRFGRRQLRQRPGRVGDRPLQVRAHHPPRTVAHRHRRRAGHSGVGRLVQPSPAHVAPRRRSPGGVRGRMARDPSEPPHRSPGSPLEPGGGIKTPDQPTLIESTQTQ
jgi:hypothetical protein